VENIKGEHVVDIARTVFLSGESFVRTLSFPITTPAITTFPRGDRMIYNNASMLLAVNAPFLLFAAIEIYETVAARIC
jgi:hypothetical protein